MGSFKGIQEFLDALSFSRYRINKQSAACGILWEMPEDVTKFPCPYLKGEVELTSEREKHIAENHPGLLPEHRGGVAETLADPDEVRRSSQLSRALLFSKRYEGILGGKAS